jgi:hypothetical protein
MPRYNWNTAKVGVKHQRNCQPEQQRNCRPEQ